MKFIHLSDLHIGLRLKNYDLREDQQYILDQIVQKVEEICPDAVVIAGDIYDKSIPSAEAVNLFSHFVTKLSSITPSIPIMIISGNHDSAERIDCFRSILSRQNVYIVGVPPKCATDRIQQVVLEDEFGKVHFYLLPFIKPAYVRGVVEEEINSYEQAVACILEREEIDYHARNVLVSHQFFVNGEDVVERMESEITTVGNIDAVSSSLIMQFDYAALGHIHKPMPAGAGHLQYCGTPMQYSVDEAGQEKGMLLVTLQEKDKPVICEKIPLTPLRYIRKISGRLEDILAHPTDDFVHVTLTDREDFDTLDMQQRLRDAFPRLLEIRREHSIGINYDNVENLEIETLSPYEMFCAFYPDISEEEKAILQEIINTELMK